MTRIFDATKPPTVVWVDLAFEIHDLRFECRAKQAQIDELMFEYCPDDMTKEQIKNWENYQVSGKDKNSTWWVKE